MPAPFGGVPTQCIPGKKSEARQYQPTLLGLVGEMRPEEVLPTPQIQIRPTRIAILSQTVNSMSPIRSLSSPPPGPS